VRLAFATVFKSATKVPSILIPSRLESRLRPLRFENRRLRETLGWTPPLDYQQCLVRTYGPAAPATAGRLGAGSLALSNSRFKRRNRFSKSS
jgi:hypothetical protein